MKINGKELADIIKNGILNIVGDVKSIKTRQKGNVATIQNGNVVKGNIYGGDHIEGNKFTSINNGTGTQYVAMNQVFSGSNEKRVWINGKEIPQDIANTIISINVDGNVGSVDSAGSVCVGGDCSGKIDSNGAVEIKGNVVGDINANGRIQCGDITGNVEAMGRIDCGNVGGDIESMGNVSMRR